ncbi:hypothetical protein TrST_g9715 [Triparma strigata]|uniref:CAAX prenyl protease n=1 Tax=Triparma strigata TaxID=1606541 RepID=A0A9W6ZS22_9STRA|nr:hypothetical protein TrST_g9715 [Triparma strigata]
MWPFEPVPVMDPTSLLPTFMLGQLPDLPACPSFSTILEWSNYDCNVKVAGFSVGFSMFAVIAFTCSVFAFELMLDLRQRAVISSDEQPTKLYSVVGAIDAADKTKKSNLKKQIMEKFVSSQAYGLDKINFSIFSQFYGLIEGCGFMLLGAYPYLWKLSIDLGAKLSWTEADEIKLSCLFFVLMTFAGEATGLPLSIYSTFFLEKKHGFNKTTPKLFVKDKIQSIILTFAIGSPVLALLLYIVKSTGELFYLYAWALMFVFSVTMMTIYPAFIMPIFNKFDPLPEGDLKTSIEALASSINYPLTKLFIIDGSKRSSHSNAFMFGFGKNKRIVLFDTLMKQVTNDEILSILGHELGHWALSHTLVNFVVTQLYFGAAFFGYGLCLNTNYLYSAFGFDRDSVPTLISLILFMLYFWAPLDKVISFLLTINTRMAEFAADRYSIGLGMKTLQSGLTKIHIENLGSMKSDKWYSTYHYSHPPLAERLEAMAVEEKRVAGKSK